MSNQFKFKTLQLLPDLTTGLPSCHRGCAHHHHKLCWLSRSQTSDTTTCVCACVCGVCVWGVLSLECPTLNGMSISGMKVVIPIPH